MEFKGTKGKWVISHWSRNPKVGLKCVIKENGITYYEGDGVWESTYGIRSEIEPTEHNIQASFEGAHIADIPDFSEESLANARLISKAPEMFEMLKKSERTLREIYDCDTSGIQNLIKEICGL